MIEFRILGPLEVVADGHPLDLGGPKQRTLLALLLLEANRVVSTDRLVDALWENGTPETAKKALQVYVSQLRKLLGKERVETRPPGYLIQVGDGELDLDRFRSLHAEGRAAEALALWRGPALADFAYQGFAQAEIQRLEELRLGALEDRIESDLAQGKHRELTAELEALARDNPLRERLRAQLMVALYRSGRQGEALDEYQEARRALVDELGIEPSRELRQLHQAILNQSPSLDLAAAAEAPAETPRGVFVGREQELAQLLTGLDDALGGRGSLFLLVGEPGIGKSRLAEEVIREARTRGARVLVGRCWEAGGAPAYWPWEQSLRGYVRDATPAALREQLGAGAAEIAQILPELRELLPGLPEPSSAESESARFRLFDATAEFLRRAARDQPIVLVLDDLHAADTPSLLLLQFVAREVASTRMLVVGAFRDVDPIPGRSLTAMLAEVAREPRTRRISLGGLQERDVAEYVEQTAAEIASPALIAALYDETEGNPLFVGETVRLLALEGAGATVTIPQTVRDVIGRRLAHLSGECNRVLVLASVLGREFALDALAQTARLSDDALLETLDEAMAARVVSDVPGVASRLRFAHVVIRDTLYERLTTARRVRLHKRAVEALETLHAEDSGPHLAELAHHAIAGSDFAKGLRYAGRAGDRALALLAYEEAARLYETGLEVLELAEPADGPSRCELLLKLGDAEIQAGDSPAAKTAFLEAAGIARRRGLRRELARAAAGYGGRIMFARAGADSQLVALLEEGLAALGDEDVELRARLLARLAGALRDEPSRDRRDEVSRQAVELARHAGNPAALAFALDGRAAAILGPDTVSESLALGTELRVVAEGIGDADRLVHAYTHRIMAMLILGDIASCEVDLAAMARIADELRQPEQLWEVAVIRAMLASAAGRLSEAERLIPEARALGEGAQPTMAIPVSQLQRYALLDFHGRLEEIEPEILALVGEYPARPVFRCALAHLQARLGRPSAREELHDLVRDRVSALPFDQEWLFSMSLVAETSALIRDREAGRVLCDLLAPWATLNAVDDPEGIRGSVPRYLGILASTLGRLDDAERHFEAALTMNEAMGARPWLAHTQHDYARMLRSRNAPGDAERAEELLSLARATYRELGMTDPG